MYQVLDQVADRLPAEKPRYLMGVGTPADLVQAIRAGIDMFDCVMPTRNARNGWLFTRFGRSSTPAVARPAANFRARTCTTCTVPAKSSVRGSIPSTIFSTICN